ncbi:MAG: hypothetical protein R3C16_00630 [Hyphomonadaceae bacterium]
MPNADEQFAGLRKGLLEFAILTLVSGRTVVYVGDIHALKRRRSRPRRARALPLLPGRREDLLDHHGGERHSAAQILLAHGQGRRTARRTQRLLAPHHSNARGAGTLIMERVVTINLNGNPYQLEEPAYDALRAYMDRAERALADNPGQGRDRARPRTGDRRQVPLPSASKSVVSAAEMSTILTEMGPVEGDDGAADGGLTTKTWPACNGALYRIYDRTAWIHVSAGLAAYAGTDPACARLLGHQRGVHRRLHDPRLSGAHLHHACRLHQRGKWPPRMARRSTRRKCSTAPSANTTASPTAAAAIGARSSAPGAAAGANSNSTGVRAGTPLIRRRSRSAMSSVCSRACSRWCSR